ncbi:stage III sporulation protein SpoIIIAB [Desmospora profundinema]|uniref:Stage III sporulation protein AB n=1 Tax=Desmospora profundinema TaxID=1571184 RepID=A0ABU1IJ02_9BACL|nr:stage III sporulation protein SpoIIIAB [Desmospora profundinema]MDR6224661.1 stage III sporulation protein AB [Desmospora profundinema]
MIKLVGAAFILFASTAAGFLTAKRYADRPRQIRQLRSALSLLQTEITFGSRRLDRVCSDIAHREPGPIGSLFGRAGTYMERLDGASTFECWQQAVLEVWPHTVLKDPEKQVLIDFGKTLGISDRDDQLQNLRRVQKALEKEETDARDEQSRYEHMCRSLGVLGGALIVILIY